ncbi:MAG: hypothetical protein KC561_17005, partial [Myxococcales bacterium]|nr:hypothetical protein [Myxococcales bacterium]
MNELAPPPSAGDLVRHFGRARKSLGQCFLTDPSILERIVETAQINPGGPVVEIGPGPGGLTRTLLARGHTVTAIELDERAISHLQEQLAGYPLSVLHRDALNYSEPELDALSLEPLPVVGNLPYNVGTEIFFHFERFASVSSMTFMYQR